MVPGEEGEAELGVALGLAARLYSFVASYASYELRSVARRLETIRVDRCSLDHWHSDHPFVPGHPL